MLGGGEIFYLDFHVLKAFIVWDAMIWLRAFDLKWDARLVDLFVGFHSPVVTADTGLECRFSSENDFEENDLISFNKFVWFCYIKNLWGENGFFGCFFRKRVNLGNFGTTVVAFGILSKSVILLLIPILPSILESILKFPDLSMSLFIFIMRRGN